MEQSPFLRLPLEIRLIVYDLLLRSTETISLPHGTNLSRLLSAAPGYHDYESAKAGSSATVAPTSMLKIRTEDPLNYEQRRAQHVRTRYMVRSDRFRARCMNTTYHLIGSPSIHATILSANSRIHSEAAETLYSTCTFDFDTHVEAIVPFFSDLTPFARSCVRSIRLVKRALPYEKEFDRAEWSSALVYIAENMSIESLHLGVVAGKPGPQGWDVVPPYNQIDFQFLKEMDGMEWVQDLLEIKTLERLEVSAVVEHCPPPMSTAMARYVKFSASIDGPFALYLQEQMVSCR